ncbi:hypothetical protein QL285_022388 [Trifolium repens]|jgi:hypothetical protein|nr:hypothetical protein QL285_022388 [Trifolium repens]
MLESINHLAIAIYALWTTFLLENTLLMILSMLLNDLEHQKLNDHNFFCLLYITRASKFKVMFYCRGKSKKIYYDPIDDIDFWVNQEAPHELDINEIKNFLYHDDAIPIVENSLRNKK